MKTIFFPVALSVMLIACDANEQHVNSVLDHLKGVSRTAKNMQKTADTIAAGINKVDREVRYLSKQARSMRDTSTAQQPQKTKEEVDRQFDSLKKAIMD